LTFEWRDTVDIGIVAAAPAIAKYPLLFVQRQTVSLDTLLRGPVPKVQHLADIDCGQLQPPFSSQQIENVIRDCNWVILGCFKYACVPPDQARLAQQSSC
jgi:hypothetical protein